MWVLGYTNTKVSLEYLISFIFYSLLLPCNPFFFSLFLLSSLSFYLSSKVFLSPPLTMLLLLSLLLGLVFSSLAQHVHYDIPQVAQDAQYVLSRFHHWHSYHGPTGTATRATATGKPTPALLTPTSACSYWLEDIKHQGLSPFHADPTAYQVFRNVKDFGAKGMDPTL